MLHCLNRAILFKQGCCLSCLGQRVNVLLSPGGESLREFGQQLTPRWPPIRSYFHRGSSFWKWLQNMACLNKEQPGCGSLTATRQCSRQSLKNGMEQWNIPLITSILFNRIWKSEPNPHTPIMQKYLASRMVRTLNWPILELIIFASVNTLS